MTNKSSYSRRIIRRAPGFPSRRIRARFVVVVSAWAAFGCSSHRAPESTSGLDAGAAMDAPAPAPSVPLLSFDGSIPTCAPGGGERIADAGAIPDRDCGAGAPAVSFQNDIVPLLAGQCTGEGCHETSWEGSPREYEALVNTPTPECCDGRKRVDPVHPDQSYVLQKLRGVNICQGRKMPLNGSISPAQFALIATWICQGAKND